MNLSLVKKIADSVLYEGYLLYPYRASAVKNRQRFNFGVLMPEAYSIAQSGTESWRMQTECIVNGDGSTRLNVKIRFLHLLMREVGKIVTPQSDSSAEAHSQVKVVESLEVSGRIYQSWQEAIEREADLTDITIDELLAGSRRMLFWFPSKHVTELLRDDDGKMMGVLYRDRQAVEGCVKVRAEVIADNTFKISVEVENLTPFEDAERKSREEALMHSLASAHTIISLHNGQFVSLLDPPRELNQAVSRCSNIGTFPVLVGDEGERDLMLSSPIILYDYPKIAEESAGDLFDSTEIDEILTLRILTMTDEEKREMRYVDEHARRILERTESLPPEQLMKMHGTVRGLRPVEEK